MTADNPETQRFAAVDVGTNSFHMVVVQINQDGRYKFIGREKEAVRLGSGAGDLDLTPEAMARGVEALTRFSEIAKNLKADIRVVATSAVREARNRGEFKRHVLKECGIQLEVVSGIEEARLIYMGALQALPIYDKKTLMIDIGGGSTEFLIGKQGAVQYALSVKLGAIRLMDRFFDGKVLTREQVKACRKFIRVSLSGVVDSVRELGFDFTVGCSGTIDTLREMISKSASNGDEEGASSFTAQDLDRVVDDILECSTPEERLKLPGLDEKRADIIVGGALILQEAFRLLGIKELNFSSYALREGVLYDTLERKRLVKQLSSDIRRDSVVHLMETFYKKGIPGVIGTTHISRLALNIFYEMKSLGLTRELTDNDAFLLEASAMLHNIGMLVAHSAHHKHSYYIIKNSDQLMGFTRQEVKLIALLSRYHRKALPTLKHEDYEKLLVPVRRKIDLMGPMLRLAIALDRSNSSAVERMKLIRGDEGLTFQLQPAEDESGEPRDIHLELWTGRLKCEWFERSYGMDVSFRVEEPETSVV